MRSVSIITKTIFVAASILTTRSAALADTTWAKTSHPAKAQAMSQTSSGQRMSASSTAIVHGTFYLVSTSCVGTSDAFNALFSVRQSGYRFIVQDSGGMKLTGRGNRAGFSVSTRKLDRRAGVTTTHVISAGPVLSDYTANFRYTATLRRNVDGASCQAVFEGNLQVN